MFLVVQSSNGLTITSFGIYHTASCAFEMRITESRLNATPLLDNSSCVGVYKKVWAS